MAFLPKSSVLAGLVDMTFSPAGRRERPFDPKVPLGEHDAWLHGRCLSQVTTKHELHHGDDLLRDDLPKLGDTTTLVSRGNNDQ